MILKFTNNTAEMTLSRRYKLSYSPYKIRVGIQKRYAGDGGKTTGDERVDPREIVINFEPSSKTDAPYLALLNSIAGFFRKDLAPFYLVDTENARRTEIRLSEINDNSPAGLEWRLGNDDLKFIMLDSHWEDETAIIVSSGSTLIENDGTITVNNSSYLKAYPVIYIRPTDGNAYFQIKNNNTGESFAIGSNSFVPGAELQISSIDGSIKLDNGISLVELSSALADGSSDISLNPGDNVLVYKSAYAGIEIDIEYRRRYAI